MQQIGSDSGWFAEQNGLVSSDPDSHIKDLFTALDAAVDDMQKSSTDRAAVEAELASGLPAKPVYVQLDEAFVVTGLQECTSQ